MESIWSALAPGFGFHPNGEMLIKDYLMPKTMGIDDPDFIIPTINGLCNFNPSEIIALCEKPWNLEYCYFFCKWNQYGKGSRCYRKTETGYWKKTGKELLISDSKTKKCIGKRSILVFYKGRNSGVKTEYVMHVYELTDGISSQCAQYVICRLQIDSNKTKKTENKVDTPSNIDSDPNSAEIQHEDNNGLGECNFEQFSPSEVSSFLDEDEPSMNTSSDGGYSQMVSSDLEPVYTEDHCYEKEIQASYESVDSDSTSKFYVPTDESEGIMSTENYATSDPATHEGNSQVKIVDNSSLDEFLNSLPSLDSFTNQPPPLENEMAKLPERVDGGLIDYVYQLFGSVPNSS